MRDQILDAARKVLHERGIMGATTREIAREAGCADGTLYNHFRTREDLFLALFDRTLPMLRETLGDLPLQVGQRDVGSNLTEVFLAALTFFREVVPIFTAVFSDPALNEGYRTRMKADNRGPHKAAIVFERYLAAEQRMKRIAPDVDPAATSVQIISIVFFKAFSERFLGAPRSDASDRRWAASQVAALTVGWE